MSMRFCPRSTILLVEDDPENRLVLGMVLRMDGYSVIDVATGSEAVVVCSGLTPTIDLLVADVALPDYSGTEIALSLMESRPDVPVLFISGTPIKYWSSHDQTNVERLRPELVDFLEKPFFPADLLMAARKLLAKHSGAVS